MECRGPAHERRNGPALLTEGRSIYENLGFLLCNNWCQGLEFLVLRLGLLLSSFTPNLKPGLMKSWCQKASRQRRNPRCAVKIDLDPQVRGKNRFGIRRSTKVPLHTPLHVLCVCTCTHSCMYTCICTYLRILSHLNYKVTSDPTYAWVKDLNRLVIQEEK